MGLPRTKQDWGRAGDEAVLWLVVLLGVGCAIGTYVDYTEGAAPPTLEIDTRWDDYRSLRDPQWSHPNEDRIAKHLRGLRHFRRQRKAPEDPQDPVQVREALKRPWSRWQEQAIFQVHPDGSYNTVPGPYPSPEELRRLGLPQNAYDAE